jgi:hypothetical protein
MRLRATIVGVILVIAGVAIGLFVTRFLTPTPETLAASGSANTLNGRPVVDIDLTSVGAVGSGPHPSWVGYLPTTYFHVPAGAVVRVTINQQDSATGLRNEYFGLVRGTVDNQMTVNGQVMQAIDPTTAAHTFSVPDLGVNVPLPGVPADAPANAQETVQFEFVVPDKPALIRWQCFVPCGAGTLYGNGGPMQTLGYMAGEIQVG